MLSCHAVDCLVGCTISYVRTNNELYAVLYYGGINTYKQTEELCTLKCILNIWRVSGRSQKVLSICLVLVSICEQTISNIHSVGIIRQILIRSIFSCVKILLRNIPQKKTTTKKQHPTQTTDIHSTTLLHIHTHPSPCDWLRVMIKYWKKKGRIIIYSI